jgi:hypothetical protein
MSLTQGKSQSCECLKREVISRLKKKHGMTHTPEYHIWQNMKRRCYDPAVDGFPNYGGRGIKVCDRWYTAFEAFLADMGRRPSPELTLERRDNDGPYSPENCYWAPDAVQRRNKRSNHLLTLHGETLCLQDWAKKMGWTPSVISQRLRRGWSVEKALTTPCPAKTGPKPKS